MSSWSSSSRSSCWWSCVPPSSWCPHSAAQILIVTIQNISENIMSTLQHDSRSFNLQGGMITGFSTPDYNFIKQLLFAKIEYCIFTNDDEFHVRQVMAPIKTNPSCKDNRNFKFVFIYFISIYRLRVIFLAVNSGNIYKQISEFPYRRPTQWRWTRADRQEAAENPRMYPSNPECRSHPV